MSIFKLITVICRGKDGEIIHERNELKTPFYPANPICDLLVRIMTL